MRRLLALLLVLGAGCQWTQGWHWPRQGAETVVYFEDHTAGQTAFVGYAAYVWNFAENVQVYYTTQCPSGSNCVRWYTESNSGGRTVASIGGAKHLVAANVYLDWGVGYGNYGPSVNIACHEAGHALGGGFDDPGTPWDEHGGLCIDGWPTSVNYDAIRDAYAPHPE